MKKKNAWVQHGLATQNPNAWIVKNNRANSGLSNDRGRVKIYPNNTVYLEDGQEFEIEIFNPLTISILCIIKVQNNLISKNGLVVRPGERVYLDCFIDSRKKFKYNTYTVDSSEDAKKAISFNGLIDIDFYKEEVVYTQEFPTFNWGYLQSQIIPTLSNTGTGNINLNHALTNNQLIGGSLTISNNTGFASTNINSVTFTTANTSQPKFRSKKSIETGIINSGGTSDIVFKEVSNKFETYKMGSISYKILPSTTKPITSSDIIQKIYCSKCGRKSKNGENFCPSCGSKLI